MNSIVEKILMDVIAKLLDDKTLEEAKAAMLEFLAGLAAKTPTELDDFVVAMLKKFLDAKVAE